MTFKDFTSNLKSRVRNTFGGRQEEYPENNLATGGFSGYHPKIKQDPFSTQSRKPVQAEPVQEPMTPPQYNNWNTTSAFAAANPANDPAGQYAQNFKGWAGEGQIPQNQQAQTGWQQQAQQQTGWQQPQQTGWQQQAQQTGWQQQAQQQPQQTGWQQQAQQQPQPQQNTDNIRYMPGMFVENGQAYSHVERIAQLMSISACFRIIEFMQNGESVVLNMEAIDNDTQIQRSLDMLAGAAYTLRYSMTKITQVKRAYLLAPKAVLVLQDQVVGGWAENSRTQGSYEQSQYAAPESIYGQGDPYQQNNFQEAAFQRAYQQTWRQDTGYQTGARTQAQTAYSSDTRKGVYGKPGGFSGNGAFGIGR